MPRPPPPFSALNSTGKPTSAATRCASSTPASTPSLPGITCSPAARIAAFARVLLPISAVTCGGGPMNVTPCCAHRVASSGFSDRKPQPGWSAEQRVCTAACTTRSTIEVALRRAAGAEHDDLAAAQVRRVAIGLADGEHRRDAERVARARDAHGDLAAVRDEEAVERAHFSSFSMQASALETSNLPGASTSTDLTTPSST